MKIYSLISKNFLSNTFIVENNNQFLIFDCGATVEDIKKIVKNNKVIAVFLTHGHFDHIFNLDSYVKAFNCKVYCSAECFKKLSDPDKNLSNYFLNNALILNQNAFLEIKNEIIEVAGLKIKPYHLLGHSNCSVAYLIENNLICGDIIFENGVGRTDFYDGNVLELEKSLKKIMALAPINIYCGHGNNFYLQLDR